MPAPGAEAPAGISGSAAAAAAAPAAARAGAVAVAATTKRARKAGGATAAVIELETLPRHCPVAATLERLGGKWKPSILYLLCHHGDMRFNALKRALPGITQRVLTLQLRVLEIDGIIERRVHHSVPPQVEYSLSALGRSLGPVMDALGNWGIEQLGRPPISARDDRD